MTVYPTQAHVWEIHRRVVEVAGGDPGVRDAQAVEAPLQLVQQEYFGQPASPTLAEKAAYLVYAFTSNHGFVDGNKRTAFVVMLTFLHLNRRHLSATVDEAERAFWL